MSATRAFVGALARSAAACQPLLRPRRLAATPDTTQASLRWAGTYQSASSRAACGGRALGLPQCSDNGWRLPRRSTSQLVRQAGESLVSVDGPPEGAELRSFANLGLSEGTQRAIREGFKYDEMTKVQREVLPLALTHDTDFVVRAHTGTGKTLAFLVPIAEALLSSRHSKGVGALVVAPTRELCLQVGKEAEVLLSAHRFGVVTLIGGGSPRQDQLTIRRKKPHLIVATPGRLLEHLERTFLFSSLFEELHTLVLDEADRLMSLGFLKEIKEIISYLPAKRRSMMFSATMSDNVMAIAVRCFRGNYRYVDCVGENDAPTACAVAQTYVALPGHQCMPALYNLLMNEMARDKYRYKVIVFFPTARLTMFMAKFFRQQLHIPVQEIHRRRDAAARQATQAWFQAAQTGILFSSDVSARGMDYPNVSLVIQFGAPSTREVYIHRVGRTARAGKKGRAVLILGELEMGFLRGVDDLPLTPEEDQDSLQRVNEIVVKATTSWIASAPMREAAAAAFSSLLVHYKATHRVLYMGDDDVVQAASDLLLGCGLVDQPVISKRLATLLGLERHPQIRCAARFADEETRDALALEPGASDDCSRTRDSVGAPRQKRRRAPWREG